MKRTGAAALLFVCLTRVSAADPIVAVEAARAAAGRRVGLPGCRALLAGYEDAGGKPLSRNLDALGLAPRAYVDLLLFRPAPAGARACAEPSNVFFTAPGSRVVYVCEERIARLQASDPRLAAALVLHEMLHSLGLGENPPSPAQITARVLSRCL